MHTKPIFSCFHKVFEIIFDSTVLIVISLLGFTLKLQTLTRLYFEIQNLYQVWNLKFKTWMGNYSAPLSPVDIQKPAPNFQSEVLGENSEQNESKRNWVLLVEILVYTHQILPLHFTGNLITFNIWSSVSCITLYFIRLSNKFLFLCLPSSAPVIVFFQNQVP